MEKIIIKARNIVGQIKIPALAMEVARLEKKWGAQVTDLDRFVSKRKKEWRNSLKKMRRDLEEMTHHDPE